MGTVPILLSINDSKPAVKSYIKTREKSLEGVYECLRERMPRNGRIFVRSSICKRSIHVSYYPFTNFSPLFPIEKRKKRKKKKFETLRKISCLVINRRGKKRKCLLPDRVAIRCRSRGRKSWAGATLLEKVEYFHTRHWSSTGWKSTGAKLQLRCTCVPRFEMFCTCVDTRDVAMSRIDPVDEGLQPLPLLAFEPSRSSPLGPNRRTRVHSSSSRENVAKHSRSSSFHLRWTSSLNRDRIDSIDSDGRWKNLVGRNWRRGLGE